MQYERQRKAVCQLQKTPHEKRYNNYILTNLPTYLMRLLKGLLIASALLVISQGHGKNCSTNCFSDIKTNFQGGLINKSIQLFVSLDRW